LITFEIIRGHRLILWSRRLGFTDDELINRLDKQGTYYVLAKEKTDEDKYTLVVLVKIANQDSPFPIIFECDESQLQALVEKVQMEV
jgi:hypothetical protein